MKWLVYVPVHNIPYAYPAYSKDEIAPVHEWYEYRTLPLLKDKPEFWFANSKKDPVRGSYCGAPIRLLKADFTFGWNIESFDNYDGIIVCGTDETVYLRKQKRYNGIIITMPRLPLGALKLKRETVNCSDLILLNHECGVENVENFNKENKTDKFFLLPIPTIDINFLKENFYRPLEEKEEKIITYRVSSGPPRKKKKVSFQTLKRIRNRIFSNVLLSYRIYMKLMHKTAKKVEYSLESDRIKTLKQTAKYLEEFQRLFLKVK